MTDYFIPLTNRAVLQLEGEDSRNFLQGLLTNDINKLTADNALYALMLTAQGKFLYDFFITEHEGGILLDCNADKLQEIKKKLSMYKLRSKVNIADVSDKYQVVAISRNHPGSYPDPRSNALPYRVFVAKPVDYSIFKDNFYTEATITDYEKIRINLNIPSDSDMESDKSFPLDYEMDTHNAIDYKKGCYVGQEITARTHYRGTVKKKPYIVKADTSANLEEFRGQEISSGTAKIGIMCSAAGNTGIALLRVEDVEKAGEIEVGSIKLNIT